MSNPDITPVGFAATDHPHSALERRRSLWWLALGGILVAIGIGGVGLFIWQTVAPTSDPVDDAVARGQVAALFAPAAPAATFTVGAAGQYTVWIDTGGVIKSGARDTIVSAANCVATFSDGAPTAFRGAVQGSSVVDGDFATVGTFDAPAGLTGVACHSELFGARVDRDQLEKERTFFVTTGSPETDWVPFVAMFVGIPALILGTMALGRGWMGTLRPRRNSL